MRGPTLRSVSRLPWPLAWALLAAGCGFLDPLDQRGLGVTLLPADTAVYVDHEFQARGLMVNYYGDQYPSDHMSYGGPDSVATVTSGGVVHGRYYGRARVLVSREEFEAQSWVSVVPQGTMAVGRSPNFDPLEMVVMGVDGSGVKVLVSGPQVFGIGPSWLGDGSGVLYTLADSADGSPHLFVDDVAGHQRRLVSESEIGFEGKARASRDGQWVYFVRRINFAPGLGIWRIHPDGGGLEQVTEDGDQDDPEPSPDGASLAYVALIPNVGYHLVVRNLTSGEVRDLGVEGASPRWSPDGRTIAFACGGNLCRVDSDGGDLRFIVASGEPYSGEALDWSPDGRWLLARGSTHLQVIDMVSGLILPLGYSSEIYFASWKP